MAINAIYIKPMTWAGKTKYYVGLQDSNVKRSPASRLGSYYIVVKSMDEARSIAEHDAAKRKAVVIVCDHFVGL